MNWFASFFWGYTAYKFISLGHNLDSDETGGLFGPGDISGADPSLGPLVDNGGTTLTHALLPDSPAIDAGDNTGAPATDQRGVARPIDGDGDGIAVVDIGAYEFVPIPHTMAVVDIDPDTLELKSKGKWITAYIELPEGHNVTEIDIKTVMLNNTIPAVNDTKYGFVKSEKSYIMNHDGDEILERMVKFDRQSVIDFINQQGITNGQVTLMVTGKVADINFEGSDTIRVK